MLSGGKGEKKKGGKEKESKVQSCKHLGVNQDWKCSPSPFPSHILLLSCYNKPCLLKTSNLVELSKRLLCSDYLQSTDGCLKLLFLTRTTDAGHRTIIRAVSSRCSMSMKPLRSAIATPSAKLLSLPTRRLGQVGHGCCGAETAAQSRIWML